jgi:hypothetical protein
MNQPPKSILDTAPEFHFSQGNIVWHRVELAFRRWRYARFLWGRDHKIAQGYWKLYLKRQHEARNFSLKI